MTSRPYTYVNLTGEVPSALIEASVQWFAMGISPSHWLHRTGPMNPGSALAGGWRYLGAVSPQQQIRVIVGEDEPFVREGITHVLHDAGFDVVGTAANARDLVGMARHQPARH